MGRSKLSLFGGFEIGGDAAAQPGLPRKARAMLAYLALQPGHAQSREKLAALLWGSNDDAQARLNLRQALWTLRKAVPLPGGERLRTDGDNVVLDLDGIDLDVARFTELVARDAPEQLEQAVNLYRGDLLDGFSLKEELFEDWLRMERARLRTIIVAALERLVAHYFAAESLTSCARAAAQLLAFEPVREDIHRVLMRTYAAQDRLGVALKQYEICRDALARDLGLQPERDTTKLYEELKTRRMSPGKAPRAAEMPRPALAIADKPSIAVLPFVNKSGDPEQQYFSDGITEDIITELSRFRSLPVMARNSSAKLGVESAAPLDVDYVVQGSVRKAGDQVRITAQLVDVGTGSHLWAERYDRGFSGVFSAQDEIVALIVGTIEGQMIVAAAEKAKRKPPTSMRAYDYVLRALALPYEDLDAEEEQFQLLTQAVALEPTYGLPHALLATVAMLRWFRDMKRRKENLDEICRMAEKAVALDDSESLCHSTLSWVYLYCRSYDQSEIHGERALSLTPNRSAVLADHCEVLTFLGKPMEAITALNKARQLDPYHAEWLWWNLGRAHLVARQYSEATVAFAHVMKPPYFVHAYMAACHAQLGQSELASARAGKVMQIEPDFSLRSFMETEPFKQESDAVHLLAGLRKAGLPE
jgi:TolB-like protein